MKFVHQSVARRAYRSGLTVWFYDANGNLIDGMRAGETSPSNSRIKSFNTHLILFDDIVKFAIA